jgi:hypothetical protein
MTVDQILIAVALVLAGAEGILHRSLLAGAFAFYMLSLLV